MHIQYKEVVSPQFRYMTFIILFNNTNNILCIYDNDFPLNGHLPTYLILGLLITFSYC